MDDEARESIKSTLEIVCRNCGVTFVRRAHFASDSVSGSDIPPLCSQCRARARSQRKTPTPNYTGETNEYRSPMKCYEAPPRRRKSKSLRASLQPRRQRSECSQQTKQHTVRRRLNHQVMYTDVCRNCGATAHVPFQPSKFQHVLCRACFAEYRASQQALQQPLSTVENIEESLKNR